MNSEEKLIQLLRQTIGNIDCEREELDGRVKGLIETLKEEIWTELEREINQKIRWAIQDLKDEIKNGI